LPTVIAAIAVALLISAIVATAGYYLQVRMRRLEQLEETFRPISPPVSGPLPEKKESTSPLLPLIAASLVTIRGESPGTGFKMKGRLLIGRDPNLCDVVLDDRDVSRQHARIRQEGKEFFIYDDASMNGTFVNGQRIDRAPLHDGDRIEVGNTELEFRVEGKE
jgi:hypothetical protein